MTTNSHRAIRTLHQDLDERPFLVIWEVSRACALVCAHCRADAQHHRDPLELTTEEGHRLLDDLASYGPPRPMVVLTGGDPFERDDLEDLVSHGMQIGLHVSLSPSVTPLLTADRLVRLRSAGASAVSLSLDGAVAGTHDGFRGVEGVFERTLEAAGEVRSAGLRLQINTTVTADNVEELPAILDIVTGMDVSLWSVFFLVPTGRGENLAVLGAHDVEEVLHWLHEVGDRVAIKATEAPQFRRIAIQRSASSDPDSEHPPGPLRARLRSATSAFEPDPGAATARSRRPPLDVNAGRGFAFVDHHGHVYPSGFLPLRAGSVRIKPFPEIYRESPLLRSLRDPDRLAGRCGICEFREMCGGSRSRAYALNGDPLAEDPGCSWVPGPTGDRAIPPGDGAVVDVHR